jgi:tRNA(adenine34) deaminase
LDKRNVFLQNEQINFLRLHSYSMTREDYMHKAIALALQSPKFPFGAVIVRRSTGEIVGEGVNQSTRNPTYHGEIVAINDCAERHQPTDWGELDLYTTAEPCPMCQSAIEWAGIGAVYYGTSIPYLQALHWRQITIRAQEISAQAAFRNCKIVGGVLEDECNALFERAPVSALKPF